MQSDQSSLSAYGHFASFAIHNAPREDSDQTARMRRLIGIFAGAHMSDGTFLTLQLVSFCSVDCPIDASNYISLKVSDFRKMDVAECNRHHHESLVQE